MKEYTVYDRKTNTEYSGFQTVEDAEKFMLDRFEELYFLLYDRDGFHPQWDENNIVVYVSFKINGEEYSLSIEQKEGS